MKKKRQKLFATPETSLTCTDFFYLLFVLTQLYPRCFEDAYRARSRETSRYIRERGRQHGLFAGHHHLCSELILPHLHYVRNFVKTCDVLGSGIKIGQWLPGALIPSNDPIETIPSRFYGDG